MSVKRVIIPTVTMLLLASQLFGCSSASKQEAYDMLQQSTEIELEIAVPESIEQGIQAQLDWTELSSLTDLEELRTAWETQLNITGSTGNKQGMLYTNVSGETEQNNTLQVALHNKEFVAKLLEYNERLAAYSLDSYVDLDDESNEIRLAMGINGYFNILPDNEVGYSNPHETLTRAQAMSAVMRATTKVSSNVTEDEVFSKVVGDSEYNVYAQELNEEVFISTKDSSLNQATYNSTMTRAEAVYMIVNTFFSEDLASVDLNTTEVEIDDATNAGNIAETQGFTGEQTSSKVLKYMIENVDAGVDETIYKSLVVAIDKELITRETNWNLGITKYEFMDLLIEALKKDTSIDIFDTSAEEIKYGADTKFDENGNPIGTYTVYEDTNGDGVPDAEVSHNKETEQVIAEYGSLEAYDDYAKEQGADSTMGYCFIYYTGMGAGDQPSYAIDPRDGKRYEVGDTLPDGHVFYGYTDDEWQKAETKKTIEVLEDEGCTVKKEDDGYYHIYE